MFGKFSTFLKEVRIEFKKVNWPTRQQTLRYTMLIIGVSLATALFLGGLDFIFGKLLSYVIVSM
jgi:preprotein translocase subunit SecE